MSSILSGTTNYLRTIYRGIMLEKLSKNGIFDRYDGWRVRNVDAVFQHHPIYFENPFGRAKLYYRRFETDHFKDFIAEHQDENSRFEQDAYCCCGFGADAFTNVRI